MKILCIGDLNGDLLVPYGELKTKENGVISEVHFQGGGSVANTARVLGKLGAKPYFVTDLCKDNIGQYLKKEMEEYDVDMSYSPIGDNSAIICIAVLDDKGEREIFPWTPPGSTLPHFKKDSFSNIPMDDYIVFTGGMMLNNDSETMESVYSFIKKLKDETNSIFMFDFNMRIDTYGYSEEREEYYHKFVELADIVTGSHHDEFTPFTGKIEIEEIVKCFKKEQTIVIRNGGHSTYVYHNEKLEEVECEKVTPIHTVGAGDTFDGGFLYAYMYGKEILECARIGGHAASYMISHTGYLSLPEDI